MKILETESENFWCPSVHPGAVRKDATGTEVSHSGCISAGCALWIYARDQKREPGRPRHGYCGHGGIRGTWDLTN